MSSTRVFQVVEEPMGNHYHATTSDAFGEEQHLFIENSPFSSKSLDLTIHDGQDIEGPILGVSKFHRFSSKCDVQMDGDHEWVPMVKKGLISSGYSFQTPIQGENHTLSWKRTRSVGSGFSPYGNSKLVDEETQEILAVFSSDPRSLVAGHLKIYGENGGPFDHLVLLTGMVFREKRRRQTTRTARAGRDDVFTLGAAIGGAGGGGS
ncbi:hypothetical protein N7493_004532 [Penicillium malachiteum]|uniref:Uncharacterized protein n=1 Tax=Penicillium malachiteum TaxID=1324776 RepID=A0AAD6MXD6_9EURO|nr:hypothetical protein N7493_004532 [Penicillium malachiteum]